jgi:hypothetical protein
VSAEKARRRLSRDNGIEDDAMSSEATLNSMAAMDDSLKSADQVSDFLFWNLFNVLSFA